MLDLDRGDKLFYNKLEFFVRWIFSVAEYALIFGVFAYLSYKTKSVALSIITVILGGALLHFIFWTTYNYSFFCSKKRPKLYQTINFIFSAVVYGLITVAFWQIFEIYKDGLGM